jgi:hypothetical protein
VPLIDKLKQLEQEKKATAETVRSRVDAWQKSVTALFNRIENEFADLSTAGLASFHRDRIRLTEELSGSYGIEQLRVHVGGRDIFFEPVGLWIIGAAGRVDLYPHGQRHRGYMLLRQSDADGWAITLKEIEPGTKRNFQPLNRETLEQAIEALIT